MKILLTLCLCILSLSMYSQNSRRVIRERKKVIKKCSPSRNPLILLDDEKKLTQKEYLDFPDSLVYITYTKADTCLEKYKNGVINVDTKAYLDAVDAGYRKNAMREYRIGEMQCFFGNQSPLIMYGDKQITKEEFYDLDERKVAFVNFYLSDYIRKNVALPNTNGIVYVHPRAKESPVLYSSGMPFPANGRNYASHRGHMTSIGMANGEGLSRHIALRLKESADSLCSGVKATLIVSCVVDTSGVIRPLFVENVEDSNEVALNNLDKLESIANDIIQRMPKWKQAYELLYDNRKRRQYEVIREYSVSLTFYFDTTK